MTDTSIDPNTVCELIEILSAAEHDRWSYWQRYLHSQCERRPDGSLIIPADLVARWEAQMETSYQDLSEKEKESDREQVRKIIVAIKNLQSKKPQKPSRNVSKND